MDTKTNFEQVPIEVAKKIARQSVRPWHEIAQEVVREENTNKMLELVKELNDALEAREQRRAQMS